MKRKHSRKRHANRMTIVETLEPRQMFSVTGVSLLGDTTIGRQLTYTISNGTVSGTVTDTYVQAGVAGLIEIDSTSQVSSTTGNVLTGSEILRVLSTGEVDEQSENSIITAANGTQIQNDTDSYFPNLIFLPATLTVGDPVTNTVTDSDLDNIRGAGVPDNTQETLTITLQNDTAVPLTLSNGKTYQVYQLTVSETDTASDGTVSGTSTVQEYFAKGVGLVKTSQTSDGDTITDELTGDTGGNTTVTSSGTLSAGLTGNTLAASQLSGADLKGKITIAATDIGAAASKAAGTVSVYASTTGSIDSNSVLLGTAKVTATSTKPGKATITPKNVSLPAGNYTLIVRATDASGANTDNVSSAVLNVSAATVNFSTSTVTSSPATITPGKPVTIKVSLLNTGNAPTVGATTVSVALTSDGTTPIGAAVGTATIKPGIKVGKSTKASIKFTFSADLLDGGALSFAPLVTITEDGVTSTVVGSPFVFKVR